MISKFVSEIKKKRNLRSLPDDFVQDLVVEFFERYPKSEKILENVSSETNKISSLGSPN